MANGEGHLLAMTVLQKMGRNEDAKKHEAILNAIGQSIMESGDGSSAATAWFTVAPSETIFFMSEALGAEIEDHDLVHVNGHAYDKLTVRDRQGKRRVVWFNTDTNELLRQRALHPKDASTIGLSLPPKTWHNIRRICAPTPLTRLGQARERF
jgi:hypothetical protein